jgi:hypothetical protein
MAKIKKLTFLVLYVVMLVGILNVAEAGNVGIVVELDDGIVKSDCVSVDENTDGFDMLEESVFKILWSPESVFGSLVCKIEGVGTEVSGTFCEFFGGFWNFNILPNGNNAWIHSPVGHNGPGGCWNRDEFSFAGHYCAVNKDVLGYKFGSGGDEPPLHTYAQVCEKLDVKDIKVYVDGKKESGADEDGGKIDVLPGSKIELEIELENLYNDVDDVEIVDISVEGTLESIDEGDDISDDAREFDLNSEKKKKITLEFNIPKEVEDGDYDLILEIEGENERGFSYFKEIEFEVEVDKEKHDVIFDNLKFSNDNLRCGGEAELNVNIVNLGTSEEDVALTITNDKLNINMLESFTLNEDPFVKDNRFRKTYKLQLPDDTNPGKYIFFADLAFEGGLEREIVQLNVECSNLVQQEKSERETPKLAGYTQELRLQAESQIISDADKNQNDQNGNLILTILASLVVTAFIVGILLFYVLKI